MRTDAHATPVGSRRRRIAPVVPLLVLIVLSAPAAVFAQQSPNSGIRAPEQPAGISDVEQPTRVDIPVSPSPAGAPTSPATAAPAGPAAPALPGVPASLQSLDLRKPANF